MGIDYVVLARFLLTGIAISLAFIAMVTWNRRRDAPGAGTFAVLVISMAVYAFGYAGEVAQTTVRGAQGWLDFEYLALPWAGGLWVLAACRYNGVKVRAPLLFLIPGLTFVTHYTNFQHLFYSSEMTVEHRGPFWVLEVHRGPFSLLDNAYLFVCFFTGAWIYVAGYRQSSDLFRKQQMILVVCSLLPFIGYFSYLAGLTPFGLDITPVTLGLTGLLIFYGLFYCGIFELAPLGRNLIFNSIRDAVLIVDLKDRLLDFNPAAVGLFPTLSKRSLGNDAKTFLLSKSQALVESLLSPDTKAEFSLDRDNGVLSYEVRSWPILSSAASATARPAGRAVIFSDVTAQVQLREELRRQSETDPLTGIANRRRFHQALELECMRFKRGNAQFSVLMIDLDNFKDVNDRYGHPAGDVVLRKLAEILLASLRKTDLPARYGGEEFSVLLAETRGEGALVIAERIRAAVCAGAVEAEDHRILVSVSIGVSSQRSEGETADSQTLLKRADLALYRAKAGGRNRVEFV